MKLLLVLSILCVAIAKGKQCGKSKTKVHHRIIGGELADDHEFPFAAALIMEYPNGDWPFCGGSVISDRYILTAAHCVDDITNLKPYKVRVGSNDKYVGGQEIYIDDIIIHEKYNTDEIRDGYDVALLKTKETILFNDDVYDVCLPEHNFDLSKFYTDDDCVVAGWGLTNSGKGSDKLMKVEVPIIPWDTCSKTLSDGFNLTNQICAGLDEGGKDACQGDSGGFLVCEVEGSYVQVGVVSWGYGCAEAGRPGVYANVMEVNAWLEEKTGLKIGGDNSDDSTDDNGENDNGENTDDNGENENGENTDGTEEVVDDCTLVSNFMDVMNTNNKKFDQVTVNYALKNGNNNIPNFRKKCKRKTIEIEVRDAVTQELTPEEQGIDFKYQKHNTAKFYKCFHNRNNGECPKQVTRVKCEKRNCNN